MTRQDRRRHPVTLRLALVFTKTEAKVLRRWAKKNDHSLAYEVNCLVSRAFRVDRPREFYKRNGEPR